MLLRCREGEKGEEEEALPLVRLVPGGMVDLDGGFDEGGTGVGVGIFFSDLLRLAG